MNTLQTSRGLRNSCQGFLQGTIFTGMVLATVGTYSSNLTGNAFLKHSA